MRKILCLITAFALLGAAGTTLADMQGGNNNQALQNAGLGDFGDTGTNETSNGCTTNPQDGNFGPRDQIEQLTLNTLSNFIDDPGNQVDTRGAQGVADLTNLSRVGDTNPNWNNQTPPTIVEVVNGGDPSDPSTPGTPGDPGTPATTPEPATLLMMGVGLAVIAPFVRRRKKEAQE